MTDPTGQAPRKISLSKEGRPTPRIDLRKPAKPTSGWDAVPPAAGPQPVASAGVHEAGPPSPTGSPAGAAGAHQGPPWAPFPPGPLAPPGGQGLPAVGLKRPMVLIGALGALVLVGGIGIVSAGLLRTGALGVPVQPPLVQPTETQTTRQSPAPVAESTTSAPATRAPATSAPATSAPATTTDPNVAAAVVLEKEAAEYISSVSITGQYAAQVASKAVGITDPLQRAANGSNTFYAADILAEHAALRARFSGYRVIMLRSIDYSERQTWRGQTMYVTFVLDSSFTSRDAVRSWCARQYAGLSGAQLENACAPRQLKP